MWCCLVHAGLLIVLYLWKCRTFYFSMFFPNSVVCVHHADMHVDVCFLFHGSSGTFPPRSVHEWTVVGDGRRIFGPTVWLCCVFCVSRDISDGLVFVPRQHGFPKHMVSTFISGLNDHSLHSAKRRLLSREAWINEAYIVADGQIAASLVAEEAIRIPISIVFKGVSCCDDVC